MATNARPQWLLSYSFSEKEHDKKWQLGWAHATLLHEDGQMLRSAEDGWRDLTFCIIPKIGFKVRQSTFWFWVIHK
jgi:hypothetical protein